MKKTALMLLAAFAAFVSFAELITPTQKAALMRRRAVSRERVEIDGQECWVVTYKRGSEFDGCETNVARKIVGVVQNNPLQNELADVRRVLTDTETRLELKAAILAKLRARCVEKAAYYHDLEEKAKLNTSKVIWREVAEANEELIALIDGEGGGND